MIKLQGNIFTTKSGNFLPRICQKIYKLSQRNLLCGAPQGSALGPKLFIRFINYICKVSKKLYKLNLFADDTTILCSDPKLLLDLVSKEMTKLKACFDLNKLSLHLNKKKQMLFTNLNFVFCKG